MEIPDSWNQRSGWAEGFPEIVTHTTVNARDAHPDYATAKTGDGDAASRLINEIVSVDSIEILRMALGGKKPKIVPVRAIELDGRNMIPDAYAEELGRQLGHDINAGIVQINVVGHTRASGFARMARPALFSGAATHGQHYLIVDDHVGMGGTLASLKGRIEEDGGQVVLASTLTQSRDSHRIALTKETLRKLR